MSLLGGAAGPYGAAPGRADEAEDAPKLLFIVNFEGSPLIRHEEVLIQEHVYSL
jgi:hypothetical protein